MPFEFDLHIARKVFKQPPILLHKLRLIRNSVGGEEGREAITSKKGAFILMP